jgi:enoyl-CoA hydratase
MTGGEQGPQHLAIDRCNALGRIVLDRPAALNALTTSMRASIAAAMPGFARDPMIYAVLFKSLSPRAFSAGGDVREISLAARERPADARRWLKEEYTLNWLLECFSKPTVSLIDGMVMGSGVGISMYGTHRVAGEGYQFAMPETAIGLFPDDGMAFVFSRLPHRIGISGGRMRSGLGLRLIASLGRSSRISNGSWRTPSPWTTSSTSATSILARPIWRRERQSSSAASRPRPSRGS